MASIETFALLIAFWALFTGLVQMVHAFVLRRVFGAWWVPFLGGLISAGFGVAAFYYYPLLPLTFAVVWASWWLLLVGALIVSAALMERKLGMGWGWTLAAGIVTLGAGVLALLNPPATISAIIGLIAGYALLSGLVYLVAAFRLSSLKNRLTMDAPVPSPSRS
jgi:uncharacterized membrane protein HdeD (DUF308 family)